MTNVDIQLLKLIERLERLAEEREGLATDFGAVLDEAKNAGYKPAILRKAMAARRDYSAWRDMQRALAAVLDNLDAAEAAERTKSEAQGT